jgi:hypothetical protein
MKNLGKRAETILSSQYSNIEAPRPNGLKRFEIGAQIVWALNEKNAIRKAKKYPHLSVIGG